MTEGRLHTCEGHSDEDPRDVLALAASWLICAAAAIGVITAALAWSGLCDEGASHSCVNGNPSFELVFQLFVAAAGFAATLLMRFLVKRRRYRFAGAALVIAALTFASWAVLLDAATHGWDNLTLLWLG